MLVFLWLWCMFRCIIIWLTAERQHQRMNAHLRWPSCWHLPVTALEYLAMAQVHSAQCPVIYQLHYLVIRSEAGAQPAGCNAHSINCDRCHGREDGIIGITCIITLILLQCYAANRWGVFNINYFQFWGSLWQSFQIIEPISALSFVEMQFLCVFVV